MAFNKRFLSILCLCLVALMVISACNNSETPKNTDANKEPFATETDKDGKIVRKGVYKFGTLDIAKK